MSLKNFDPTKIVPGASKAIADMVGRRYGRLEVTKYLGRIVESSKSYLHVVEAKCDCGNIDIYRAASIRIGHTASCGCYQIENTSKVHKVHGHASYGRSRAYNSWAAMKSRCYNSKSDFFHCYGAIGVIVCERWKNSFPNFLEDMGDPPAGMTLDRYPDKKGNYEPSNCRWATGREQMQNYTGNRNYILNGKEVCMSELKRMSGLDHHTIRRRIEELGWSVERTIQTPPLRGKQTYSKLYSQ